MEPTFMDGSILLVDRGVSTIKTDGVYVLSRAEELYVKRVQRGLDGSLTIKSDNNNYDPILVQEKTRDKLLVLGRVLIAWNPKKL